MHRGAAWRLAAGGFRGLAVLALVALLACAGGNTARAAGLTFNISQGAGLVDLENGTPAQQQLAANMLTGFQQAANQWSSVFRDPITINVQLDYQSLGGSTLASTTPNLLTANYSDTRAALAADRTSADDFAAVANLPASSAVAFYLNHRDGSKYLKTGADPINTTLFVPSANLKAIGLFDSDPLDLDATVTFSSDFAFSFNHAAVTPGTHDFVGVAIHELGHALGFSSGVDAVDQLVGAGPYAMLDINGPLPGLGEGEGIPAFTILDLFRHSSASAAISSQTLDLAVGGTPFFSINGVTSLGRFATGDFNGDGNQASHWKFSGQGVMQPTLAAGVAQNIGPLDIRALDVMGYTLVPEPGTWALAGLGFMALAGVAYRRGQAWRATA